MSYWIMAKYLTNFTKALESDILVPCRDTLKIRMKIYLFSEDLARTQL